MDKKILKTNVSKMKGDGMKRSLFVFLGILFFSIASVQAANYGDVAFLVDESGSMSGEHAWLSGMVGDLESGLVGAGLTPNQYALVGFGSYNHGGSSEVPHKHPLDGSMDWMTASQLATETGNLVIDGGYEDGWRAIDYAIANYSFRSGAGVNFVLITDEDRDNSISLAYADVLASMTQRNILLNAVVNANFASDNYTSGVIGIDADGNAYVADGSGGFTVDTGGYVTYGYSNTEADYVNMALATGGAAWDLNILRSGGNNATSFTDAFVDIKVGEIEEQVPTDGTVPEPATMLLFGSGILWLFGLKRKRK